MSPFARIMRVRGRFLSNKFMTQLSGWMRKAKSVCLFVLVVRVTAL